MSETRERSALEVLRRVEWVQDEYGGWCPICDMEEDQGHAPDCALDAVLRSTPASDGMTRWECVHGCGCVLDSRSARYHECRGVASDGGEVRERVVEEIERGILAALDEAREGDSAPTLRIAQSVGRRLDSMGLLRHPAGRGGGGRILVVS